MGCGGRGCITRTWAPGGQLSLALGERVQEAGIANLRAGSSSLSRPCVRPSWDGRTGAPRSNGRFGGHACPGRLLCRVPVEEHREGHSEPGPGPCCPPGGTDHFGSPAPSVFRGQLLGPTGPRAGLSPSWGAHGPSSPSTADAGPAAVPPGAVSACPVGEPRARCPAYGGFRLPPTPGPTGGIPSLGQQAHENRAPWSHFDLLRAEP